MRYALLAIPLALAAVCPEPARAAFIPSFQSATLAGGSTTVAYAIGFNPGPGVESLTAGNFVTLYDAFDPAVTTFSAPSPQNGFAVTTQMVGVTPAFVTPPDSASLGNVTFTYTGAPLTTATVFPLTFTLTGDFTGGTRIGRYTSEDTLAAGPNAAVGPVRLPSLSPVVAPSTPVAPVPEPATLAAFAGLVGLGGAVARRRRAG